MDNPVVFLHGFSDKTLFDLVAAIKKAARDGGIDPSAIAFASSTPTNLNWKVKDLIREVRKEHRTMKPRPANQEGEPTKSSSYPSPSVKSRSI